MTGFTTTSLTLALVFAASSAFAQTARTANTEETSARAPAAPAPAAVPSTVLQRGYVSVNGAYQGTTTSFTNSWSVPYYLERESLNSSYSIKPAVLVDVGAGVRVWRNLTVGAAVSRYHRSDSASLTATVPHPLLYEQPRSFTGTAPGPSRTETAVHANAMWVAAAGSRVQVGVFGGPSFFSISQVFISGVSFADVYPYTTLTVAGTNTQSQTESKVGFNVGGDVTVLLYKQIGVGMLFRYTGVSGVQPVPTAGNAPSGISQSLKAGGLQVGAGFRLRF